MKSVGVYVGMKRLSRADFRQMLNCLFDVKHPVVKYAPKKDPRE